VNDVTYSRNYVKVLVIVRHNFVNIKIVSPILNKITVMGNLLYFIAVILLIAWAIGYFAFSVGSVIHILLVIALVAVILRVIQGKKLFH
jgi:hypothetical protein